ncbi:hypothetical protein PLESTB_001729700 [Pleodorina starrii]|uniref:Cyclin-like domain-containing protein n=1 Tax=Pleodorina starrii TaxID=330485 RepID=A0A9W6BZK2_9CHLO|nr:hypothetical protein PLESTM_000731900 [Pleodorina starrii]GLC61194.1 hypothetical protein PLESTB_001729700 [Pleodorina starrii]GLC75740.1 hypothetical protein PLESTF_001680300 [Pleodorina starrii]
MWRGGLGESMDFATSTHRRRWLYTKSRLEEERRRLQQVVVEGLRRQRAAADPGEPEAGSATKRPREPPPVSPMGELLMLKYYQQIIQEKCREMRMPAKVMATAIQYHKRFFLRHTSMEYDPGRVMITAIFMATKVEERYTRAADIAAAFDVSEDLVVKQEVALLEGLNFDLVVHSPYRALHGIIQELKDARVAAAAGLPPPTASASAPSPASPGSAAANLPSLDEPLLTAPLQLVDDASRAAYGALDALLLSDAPLLYGPAQLAAAALRSGFKTKGVRIPSFLARLAARAAAQRATREAEADGDGSPPDDDDGAATDAAAAAAAQADPAAALTAVLDELDSLGSEGARRVEVAEVKEANAAAREWRNLLKDAASAAGGGGPGKGAGGAGDDAARAAKREAKKAARAAAKAKEAELLGMPQRQ